jgi:hypothetical protein
VAAANSARSATRASDSASADPDAFSPTAELAQLLALVQQSPDLRAEVLEAVARRLAAGEFDSSAAAAETAEAILNQAAMGE